MLKVAICGASGYVGVELLRILAGHPGVEITSVTSEKSAGESPANIYGHLGGFSHLTYEHLDGERLLGRADLFFMALPHGVAHKAVECFRKNGRKVIDLSADFRLKDPLVYEQWYKTPHRQRAALKEAVYGLPEVYRAGLSGASLIAVPGCYPTSAILGLYPALKGGMVDEGPITIDSKSGVTGAGRRAETAFSFSEVNEGFRAYAVSSHRHMPEIEQELSLAAGRPVAVNFTPHLLPLDRGILSTIYCGLKERVEVDEVFGLYSEVYREEPFIRVLKPGVLPDIKDVRGTNVCAMGFAVNRETGTLIIVSAIDNLVKGAAGQAVQCMNITSGISETTALETTALFP